MHVHFYHPWIQGSGQRLRTSLRVTRVIDLPLLLYVRLVVLELLLSYQAFMNTAKPSLLSEEL
jgi:hypothetical protein